jgi:hypothetical protein
MAEPDGPGRRPHYCGNPPRCCNTPDMEHHNVIRSFWEERLSEEGNEFETTHPGSRHRPGWRLLNPQADDPERKSWRQMPR